MVLAAQRRVSEPELDEEKAKAWLGGVWNGVRVEMHPHGRDGGEDWLYKGEIDPIGKYIEDLIARFLTLREWNCKYVKEPTKMNLVVEFIYRNIYGIGTMPSIFAIFLSLLNY